MEVDQQAGRRSKRPLVHATITVGGPWPLHTLRMVKANPTGMLQECESWVRDRTREKLRRKKRRKRVAFRSELNERVRRRKGGFRESKRRVQMLKEKKKKQNSAWKTRGTMKQKWSKKTRWVKQIGRRANCRAAVCKIIGGMLLSSFSTSIYSSCYRNRPKLAGLFFERYSVLQALRDRPDSFTGKSAGACLVMTQKNLQAFVTVAVRRPPLHLSCQDESLLVPTSWFLLWLVHLTCTLWHILTGTEWHVLLFVFSAPPVDLWRQRVVSAGFPVIVFTPAKIRIAVVATSQRWVKSNVNVRRPAV